MRARTRWSVSQIFPVAFSVFAPPEPPDEAVRKGGASGMLRRMSTPESVVVMFISFGRGTGERLGLSIVQFSAMVVGCKYWIRQ